MKELVLLPRNIFEMLSKKNNNTNHIKQNKSKQKKPTKWRTHIAPPKIPLTQVHTPYQNKSGINIGSNKKPSITSFKDKLILYFPTENKLKKAKLLLEYFQNIIDENGNITSPPNTNKNFIDVSTTFLNATAPINTSDDLELYKILINSLSIPKSLIKNKHILKEIGEDNITLPIGGFLKLNKPGKKQIKQKKSTRLEYGEAIKRMFYPVYDYSSSTCL